MGAKGFDRFSSKVEPFQKGKHSHGHCSPVVRITQIDYIIVRNTLRVLLQLWPDISLQVLPRLINTLVIVLRICRTRFNEKAVRICKFLKDCGSFPKASEKLYISANAVTKQINLLENHLSIKLFHRSTQGLMLTDAGKVIYAEAKRMIRHLNSILQKAKELENRQEYVIHIGLSLMNPASILLEHWHQASEQYPNIRLDIVPFEDTVPAFNEVLDNLGKKIDLISCPYQTNYWGDYNDSLCRMGLPLSLWSDLR